MRYVILVSRIALALAFGLGLLIATADDPEIASLDPHRPATLLSLVASRVRAVQSWAREFQASEFLDAATANLRERLQRTIPAESLPR